jgi:hypothetical protein
VTRQTPNRLYDVRKSKTRCSEAVRPSEADFIALRFLLPSPIEEMAAL